MALKVAASPATAKEVFVDTEYWIAVFRPGDPWAVAAKEARAAVAKARLVTTEEVLTEFLTHMRTPGIRQLGVEAAIAIRDDPNIVVVPQTSETWGAGFDLFRDRGDKAYSLTDCISMATMRERRLLYALTNDKHFTQEGLVALIQAA